MERACIALLAASGDRSLVHRRISSSHANRRRLASRVQLPPGTHRHDRSGGLTRGSIGSGPIAPRKACLTRQPGFALGLFGCLRPGRRKKLVIPSILLRPRHVRLRTWGYAPAADFHEMVDSKLQCTNPTKHFLTRIFVRENFPAKAFPQSIAHEKK
jgi:hypothetical protein